MATITMTMTMTTIITIDGGIPSTAASSGAAVFS
jgi:hypothetical protein